MNVNVVNMYKVGGKYKNFIKDNSCYIYMGRGQGNTNGLYNPWEMKDKSDEERNRVCDLFQNSFDSSDTLKNTANKLYRFCLDENFEDMNLMCFCSPKRCHCDTIKNYLINKNIE